MIQQILLQIDGGRVILRGDDDQKIATSGQLFANAIKTITGIRSNCHGNCALEYLRFYMDRGIFPNCQIATGFGLNDGIWRPHSWLIADNDILETTVVREKYFGVLLNAREALSFVFHELAWLPGWHDAVFRRTEGGGDSEAQ